MWHNLLCGLLALSASVELGLREKDVKLVLTEPECASCPTCAKCAKDSANDESAKSANNGEIERDTRPRRLFRWNANSNSHACHSGFSGLRHPWRRQCLFSRQRASIPSP